MRWGFAAYSVKRIKTATAYKRLEVFGEKKNHIMRIMW